MNLYFLIIIIIIKIIYRLFSCNYTTHIKDNLFIGNFISSFNCNDFDIIVNTTKNLPFFTNKLNIRIPINDNYIFKNKELLQFSNRINYLSNIKNKKILIHCEMGIQRSCFITQILLKKIYNLNFNDSYNLIRNKRKISFMPYHNFKYLYKYY